VINLHFISLFFVSQSPSDPLVRSFTLLSILSSHQVQIKAWTKPWLKRYVHGWMWRFWYISFFFFSWFRFIFYLAHSSGFLFFLCGGPCFWPYGPHLLFHYLYWSISFHVRKCSSPFNILPGLEILSLFLCAPIAESHNNGDEGWPWMWKMPQENQENTV
jgi:hypothetical protein